jgi:hypothetical protein
MTKVMYVGCDMYSSIELNEGRSLVGGFIGKMVPDTHKGHHYILTVSPRRNVVIPLVGIWHMAIWHEGIRHEGIRHIMIV